ncbi:hypothetical protein BC629DRAFT_1734176 [Irpex lacteus]|nr:hypothetical protein BC629DRAFT_1734176 [Irpex lacteus]
MYDSATYRVEEDIAVQVFVDAAVTSTPDDLRKILDNLASYAPFTLRKQFMMILRATRIAWLVWTSSEHGVSLEEHTSSIREFWRVTKAGLRTVASIRDLWKEDYLASARQCLELISELNTSQPPQKQDDFSLDDSCLIPNSVPEDIAMYLPQAEIPFNDRLLRSPLPPTETSPAVHPTNMDRLSRNNSTILHKSSHSSHSSRRSHPETASLPYQQPTPTRDHTVAKALTM